MKRKGTLLVLVMLLVLGAIPALAQDGAQPEAQRVELAASDGLTLVGDYYAPVPLDEDAETGAPAVLLLHQLGGRRGAWEPIFAPLLEAGYAVLTVDMRAHGETGGRENWPLAEDDHQRWIDWLRAQDGIDAARVSVVGASIGSNMALRAMANDADIVTVVALSPGLDYADVTTADAVEAIGNRPVMLVAAHRDTQSVEGVRELTLTLRGDSLVRLYDSTAHGYGLFLVKDDLIPLIIDWLDWQSR
ncbi:MAG: alpha/beta fold hydrolase [Anaerolineae bacterium]|nr:alpha/beta fold hydrolase [Anaerolineae bacterium]